MEQLAGLGVNLPTELRPELALAGEWTVTSTRVLKKPGQDEDSKDSLSAAARAAGVRKREREKTEEELEEEDALKTLFKKPKTWGRATKEMPVEGDDELDQLLSGTLVKTKKEEGEDVQVKPDPEPKTEPEDAKPTVIFDVVKKEDVKDAPLLIKHESTGGLGGLPGNIPPAPQAQIEVNESQPAVVFKKRKAKAVRQH